MRIRLCLAFAALVGHHFSLLSAAEPGKKFDFGPLAEPRQRLLKGNYDEARAGFEALAKASPELAPACAIGIGRSHREVGDSEKALEILADALKAASQHPDLLAERADLLYDLGRWDDAEKDADAAIAKNDAQLLARWTRARLLRDRGKIDDADKAIRWIVRYYTSRDNADKPITNPEELVIVAEAGAENARWHNLSRQFSFILNEVIGDAVKADPDYWPAEVLAGRMLLEKYNRPDAVDAFDKALKVNPKCADALAGKSAAALQKYDIKDVDTFAEQALKANPKQREALRLKAEVMLIAGDLPAAEKFLTAARAANPRDEQTLGRLAAVYELQRRPADRDKLIAEVSGYDAKPGLFYLELADCLDGRKWYAPAEGYYRKAAELRPMLAGPRTGLGMLYLRMGREKDGRDVLAKALELDPFNVRVANSLKVMRHLDKYATITTDHYELRYDPTKDKLLAEFLVEYLEATHAELKRQFAYEPPGKILVEVFSTHEMFSGRTVALPDLHTIGACTGKVVAMASPAAKGVSKPFNWGRVIRHELTHIFNLTQTDFLCPHWLTEGLAVRNEEMNRPNAWTQILRDRKAKGELFNLDTVMLGFVRPKGPDEWSLAYCQSQLYVEYLTRKYGEGCIAKLLEAYRDGKDTAAALKAACGADKADVEKGYLAYLDEVLKPFSAATAKKPEEKPLTFAELEEEQKKNPDDPDLAARLADQLFRRNRVSEARKLADTALAKVPGHPLAAVVKARLLVRAGDEEAARAVVETAQKSAPDDPKLLLELGRLAVEAKDYEAAATAFEHGRKVAPLDGDWLEQLARIYKETKQADKLVAVLEEIVGQDPDELDGRVRLARAALEAGKRETAERFAWDAVRIDVLSKDARDVLIDALKAVRKDGEAERLAKRFAENPPRQPPAGE